MPSTDSVQENGQNFLTDKTCSHGFAYLRKNTQSSLKEAESLAGEV